MREPPPSSISKAKLPYGVPASTLVRLLASVRAIGRSLFDTQVHQGEWVIGANHRPENRIPANLIVKGSLRLLGYGGGPLTTGALIVEGDMIMDGAYVWPSLADRIYVKGSLVVASCRLSRTLCRHIEVKGGVFAAGCEWLQRPVMAAAATA